MWLANTFLWLAFAFNPALANQMFWSGCPLWVYVVDGQVVAQTNSNPAVEQRRAAVPTIRRGR